MHLKYRLNMKEMASLDKREIMILLYIHCSSKYLIPWKANSVLGAKMMSLSFLKPPKGSLKFLITKYAN